MSGQLISTFGPDLANASPSSTPVRRRPLPPPSNRAVIVCSIVGLLVAGAGVHAASMNSSGPAPSPNGLTPAPAHTELSRQIDGPIRITNHAPAGFARSFAGARAAAIAYSGSLNQSLLYLDRETADKAVGEASTAAFAESYRADGPSVWGEWRLSVATGTGPLWWVVSPLAIRMDGYNDDEARASVWMSVMVSRAGALDPRTFQVTQALRLRWERDDWKIDSSTYTPGPYVTGSDTSGRVTAAELDRRLAGYSLIGVDG